jgi:MFS family permease
MVVTCIGFALFPIIGAILAIRFIQGLAWGLTNTAAATIAADSIPKPRFGEGMGYFSLASSVAMIFTPALSLTVLYAYGGTTSVLICGCFFCLSLVASCFLVYQKLEQKTEGVRKTVERHAAQLDRAAGTTAETTTPVLTRRNSVMAFIKNTLLERSALGVALLMALTSSSYALVQTFLPALLDGDAVGNISLFFVVMAVTAIIARPVFGVWADRRNYFEPALAAFIAMTISLVLIMMNMNLGTLLAGAVFQGVGYSAGFSLFMALATHSVSNPSRRGAAIATVMVGFDIGSGLTAVVFSAFVEIVGFAALFGFGALIALFGMVWVLFHRRALQ